MVIRLRWKDTVRRDLKDQGGVTDREKSKRICTDLSVDVRGSKLSIRLPLDHSILTLLKEPDLNVTYNTQRPSPVTHNDLHLQHTTTFTYNTQRPSPTTHNNLHLQHTTTFTYNTMCVLLQHTTTFTLTHNIHMKQTTTFTLTHNNIHL